MANNRKISDDFLKKLIEGEYKEIIDFASKRENELDVQIRHNYLNIYYRGGNLLEVRLRSLHFDEFYFHRGAKDMRKTHMIDKCKKGDKACIARWEDYKKKRKEMLELFKEGGGMTTYCKEMTRIIDEWEKDLNTIGISHDEKHAQQQISMNNRGETDYTVVDLEYAVSRKSSFYYEGGLKKKVPRFDIIAVDKFGQLYVIELKTGGDAIDGESGICAHKDCFEHTIERDQDGAFVKEMSELLEQKKALKLVGKNVFIDTSKKPQFIFAFSDKPRVNYGYEEFVNACQVRGYNDKILYVNNERQLINL